ncbi:MAG: hypothetical protein K8R34_05760, partial [Methanosarcinales archaeon]|nr:hypothetical protein [Methanosarcinales archaeon]
MIQTQRTRPSQTLRQTAHGCSACGRRHRVVVGAAGRGHGRVLFDIGWVILFGITIYAIYHNILSDQNVPR